jgi:hypothetical protein
MFEYLVRKGDIVLSISIFYKKYSAFIKLILGVIIIIVHFILITDLRNSGLAVQKRLDLQPEHDIALEYISKDLFSVCSTFKENRVKKEVELYLKSKKLNYELAKKQIVSINDLIFEELIFRVFSSNDSMVYYQSNGYLVTNIKSNKCFGII